MAEYLLAAGVVFGVNLLPAFGPPTWSVLVVLQVNLLLDALVLVPLGALMATSGRLVLATGARRFRGRLSPRRLEGLEAVLERLTANRRRSLAGLGLFLVSPLPSAQLFIAAGILDAPLRPLAAAFLAGRLVSYSLYVGLATVAAENLGGITADSLRSPLGLALQLAMVAGVIALVRIDWLRLLGRDRLQGTERGRGSAPSARE